MVTKVRAIVTGLIFGCICAGLGAFFGYIAQRPATAQQNTEEADAFRRNEDLRIQSSILDEISSKNIEDYLKVLTERPHIAGRSINEVDLVNYVKSEWEKSGLDSIVVHPYDVLLSYPLQNKSNYVAILNSKGEEEFISQRKEFVIDAEQNDPNVVDPFNAYSPSGEPQGELVYVNYGRVEDFKHLNRTKHIRVVGKICIARYGKIFRGDKAIHAELYGCAGLILYSDPADYTVPWSRVYPDDWFLPSTGAQRGSLLLGSGDPRTPNYPAIKSAWHLPDQLLYTPGIPVTPIGYVDAVKYLEKLTGNEVMEEWRGGLNITYKYGPGFAGTHRASRMKMFVGTHLEVATIHNVVGYIKGEIEPDRYVIFGNHRDAWVFGAIDPSSGTAVLMEMVRAFGKMVKQGWRPRRTLVFCSWGAEEYGLIGSTEWVEEFKKELQFRAVAYLNVDISVQGNYSFRGVGASGLRDVVFEATKLISNPDPQEIAAGRTKVYDTWAFRSKNNHSESNPGLPNFPSLGSGSDYAPFQHTLGVSSVDLRYTYDKSIGLSSYPVYHSVYETFELVKKFVDPNFAYHQAVGKVWAEVGRRLAESVILPFDCLVWAKDLETKRNELLSTYGQKMVHHGINLEHLDDAIARFRFAAEKIHQQIKNLTSDTSNQIAVRALNDQLMLLERAFVDQASLPGRLSDRHVISAPSLHNSYGSTAFPGLVDAMFDIEMDPDQEFRWDQVKRQYSIVVYHILSAASTVDTVVPV